METIRYAVADGVATLTLDFPKRKNALNGTMRREIGEVVPGADGGGELRWLRRAG